MTYRQLLTELLSLAPEQLDEQDATVYVAENDEYYPIDRVAVAVDTGVLDPNHIVLSTYDPWAEENNMPCVECGNKKLPLHIDYKCPDCHPLENEL